MDKAQVLVRMVVRAFYDPEAVVIVESLIRHIALNIPDLAWIFQNALKQKVALLAQLGLLRTSGLIKEHVVEEVKPGAQKAVKVSYYYIDYRHAVDATKYRLHMMGVQLRKAAGPAEEKKEYVCPRCKSEFKEIDVIGNPSADGMTFLCLTCNHELKYVEADQGEDDSGPVGAFNQSLMWMNKLMMEIDNVTIPATTAEAALAQRDEPPRPKAQLNEHNKVEMPSAQPVRPVAVKGIVTGPQKIEVTISSDADNTAANQIAAAEAKKKQAAVNALPAWYTHSTVSHEMTAAGRREEAAKKEHEAELGLLNAENEEDKKDIKNDGLEDIFAEIEAEQAMEQAKKEQEDQEEYEDDEEEDEFEDVTTTANGNGSAQPDAKRVKLEVDTPVSQATPASGGDAEDEDEEFEDV